MLLDRHRAKIISVDDLATLRTAANAVAGCKIVLCHGVFDVVHPGHVRHLLYAKSKAAILVCSITSDRYVDKGPYRPHTPQDLRAANLAVFDIVDHVVICDEEKPLGLIDVLRPDFYAKGFEYAPANRQRPIAEEQAVMAYGGEVLYTPGDFVRSSSQLIETAAPDLRWDKLLLVMERANVTFADLRTTLEFVPQQRFHVVGDVIVDSLLHCQMIGANGKTPTLSVLRGQRDQFVGGAAVVALHARAAGAKVKFSTIIGNDAAGQFVFDGLTDAGIECQPIFDRARPTTVKEAIVVDGYRLLKIDTVDNRSISDLALQRLCEQIAETDGGAIVFSDFRHGIFNARTIEKLTKAIPRLRGCLRVADSQVASRWGNIADFHGFDLLTPNEREARHAVADQDSGVRPLAERLRNLTECRWLLMKLGPKGVLCFDNDGQMSFVLDSLANECRDPVGAGDAFLAYATLSLLVQPCLTTAAILGSMAAGIECGYDGNVPVTAAAVMAKVIETERICGG